jgi:hypothetical protein
VWQLYHTQAQLLYKYLQVGPCQRWLCRLGTYSLCDSGVDAVFDAAHSVPCIYAWVSIDTSLMYVGSTVDFKQRIYSHVRSMRNTKHFSLRAHRLMYTFGAHRFMPIPLYRSDTIMLRATEYMFITRMQPSMNVEYMQLAASHSVKSRTSGGCRRVIRQRLGAGSCLFVVKKLCVVKLLPGGRCFPNISCALQFAAGWRLRSVELLISSGDVDCTPVNDVRSVFGRSRARLFPHGQHNVPTDEGYLGDIIDVVTKPCSTDRVLVVDNLYTVGWRLWAKKVILQYLRMPCSIKQWYMFDQRSFFRLFTVVQQWHCPRQRTVLKQLCVKICRSVHHVVLDQRLLIRVPFGLQRLHVPCRKFIAATLRECSWTPTCIQRHWYSTARVVQQQGRNIGNILGNFRHVCRSVDCRDGGQIAVKDNSSIAALPAVNGNVSFRGDDPNLPLQLRSVLSMHANYIPVQQVHAGVLLKLAEQCMHLRKQLKLRQGKVATWVDWFRPQCDMDVPSIAPSSAIDMFTVQRVKRMLKGLVGVPIDKNNILFFESLQAYRQRLLSVFIADNKHYMVLQSTEHDLLRTCRTHFKNSKWDRICGWNAKGSLGYAQCLPKNKDCSLSRPIVPNFRHPLARLFNIAARGLAFVLKHVCMSHFNLFTTQQFVTELAALSTVVADCWDGGQVQNVMCIQSDIKDMYTEISHADIVRCTLHIRDLWLSQNTRFKCKSLCVNRFGRGGVVIGRSRDSKIAVSLDIDTVVSIILYELQHAYFNVGKAHVLQQTVGVSMGSKGGPVLAWAVCMVHEHTYAASLGSDAKFIHVKRYFDDVWQLLIVPCNKPATWVASHAIKLQHHCYPKSLRLIVNSMGPTAQMLGCVTTVVDGRLHCTHYNKNDRLVGGVDLNLTARNCTTFIHFSSAHAGRKIVMRNAVLGLLHRMYMNTLTADVNSLLPVLISYTRELMDKAGFPCNFLVQCVRKFRLNAKIHNNHSWQLLCTDFINAVQNRM